MNGCSVEQGFKCSAKRCFHLQVEDASMASGDRLVMKLLRSRGPLLVPVETNGGGIGRRMIPVQTRSKSTTWMIRVNFTKTRTGRRLRFHFLSIFFFRLFFYRIWLVVNTVVVVVVAVVVLVVVAVAVVASSNSSSSSSSSLVV